MFIFNSLTSTKTSILSTDDHGRDLWVTQGMTHCRTQEKAQMEVIKSLLFINLKKAFEKWTFQGHFVFVDKIDINLSINKKFYTK